MNEQIKKRISAINSGIVPKGWKSVRLDDIAEVFDGIHQTPDYKSHGIKFVSVENINGLYSSDKYISEEEYIKSYKIKPEINDILMTRIGDIGTPAIVDSDEPLAFYVSLALIKCNSKINSKYFYCFISSEFFQKELWKKTLHIAFPKKINKGDIGKCKLLLPSIEEQQKIAEILSTQDKLIELYERKIEQLKTLKKGYLQKMFPKKGAKSPELRFKGFTEPWEQIELGTITSSYSGGTPTASKSEYYDGDIPFIRSGEINEEKTELFLSELGYNNSYAAMVEKGNILYALYGATSGEVSISRLKGAINQAILAIKPNEGYDSEFLMQWLRKQKENIISTYLQGGQGNLSGTIVKSLKVDVTSYAEQQQIGSYFRNLDSLITLHQHKLDKEKQKKKALMQLLLTGKVRVIT